MAGESGEREITSVSIIQDLADTDYILVSDGIDVKKIAKKDLIKNLGTADKITLETISGMTATTVQAGIAENHNAIINAAHEEEDARKTAIADKELKSKAISIPVASIVANTDTMSADYPYCYDYALTEVTAETWADVYPTALSDASVVDACLDGCNLTSAGNIRIYFLAVPTAVANVTIVYQRGVTS